MEDFTRKINLVIAFRAVMIPLIFVTVYFTNEFGVPQGAVADVFYPAMTFFFFLNAFWVFLNRLPEYSHHALLFAHVLCDILMIAFTVFSTGGIETPFPLLYILVIMYSSLFLDFYGILVVSGLTCLAHLFTLGLLLFGVFSPRSPLPVKSFILSAEVSILGNVIVGMLTGFLQERLKRARLRVEQQFSRIQDLNEYNTYILDNIRSGLLTTDCTFHVVKINQMGTRLLNREAEAILGRNALELFRLTPDEQGLVDFSPQEQKAVRVEKWLEVNNEDSLFVGLSISPILIRNEVNGYIFIFQDLTDIKKLENEIEIQKRMAAIGNLSAAIAHEIRNPLASMTGSIQVLKKQLELTASQRHLMDIILRESHRLDRIIANFLQFAAFRKFSPREFDLAALIRETIFLFQNSPEFRPDHQVQLECPEGEIQMVGDPDQLKQVFWNLCSNAVKAMPRGGSIGITCAREGRTVRLNFRDEGRGMAPEEIQHLFEPFQSRFPGGLGLGMAIVYRIITDHGGKVDVQSTPGKGTTFSLTIPLTVKKNPGEEAKK